MLELALLGCGGGMPMPERYLSAILMNYRGRKILVDCGEGTQVSMRLLGWGFKTIDIICITHSHGDHTVGLPGLLATIGNSGRTEVLTIIGPEGITEIIHGLRVIVPFLPYELRIIENPQEPLLLGLDAGGFLLAPAAVEFQINTLAVDHSSPCLSYSFYITRRPRFDAGKAAAENIPKQLWSRLQKGETLSHEGKLYSPEMVLGETREGIKVSMVTDTRPTEELPNFIRNSRLLICEGTYGAHEDLDKAIKNKHMTFGEAAELARAGAVEELLLTHFSPVMQAPEEYRDNAARVFHNTIIGKDRLVMRLNFKETAALLTTKN